MNPSFGTADKYFNAFPNTYGSSDLVDSHRYGAGRVICRNFRRIAAGFPKLVSGQSDLALNFGCHRDRVARILFVKDHDALTRLLCDALRIRGHTVEAARSTAQARRMVAADRPDLVLVTVNPPHRAGLDLVTAWRSHGETVPIIFLASRAGHTDVCAGFRAGGDDYLPMPPQLDELNLRIDAVLRRSPPRPQDETLQCSDLVLEARGRRAHRAGSAIHLTPTELRILRHLMRRSGSVVSKPELRSQVWNDRCSERSSLVETHILRLRRKLERHGPRLIHTVRGRGYVLRP